MSAVANNFDRKIKDILSHLEVSYNTQSWHEIQSILTAKPKESSLKKWAYSVNIIIAFVVLCTVGVLVSKNLDKKRSAEPVIEQEERQAEKTPEPKKQNAVLPIIPNTLPEENKDSTLQASGNPTEPVIKESTHEPEVIVQKPKVEKKKKTDSTQTIVPPVEVQEESTFENDVLYKETPITAEPVTTEEQNKDSEKKKSIKNLLRLKKND